MTDHDDDHDRTAAPMVDEITDFEVLEIALRELCIEKGIFTAAEHRHMTEFAEQIGPTPAAHLVARAWIDPEYKELVLSDPLAASKEVGVDYATKEELFRRSDIVTIHVQLGDRSRGIVGAREIGLMKPTALLINTARGPIVDEKALIAALSERRIGGAGLDVFDVEPLPLDHPFRKMDNVVITPHLGYVSRQNYEHYFPDIVEDIRAFIDGKPVRVIAK